MIGLSEGQLEIIVCAAEPLAEERCQEFLERVAALLQVRGQINDDDVAAAVHLALRALIHNSAVWKEWNRNSLPTRQNEQGFDAPLAGPHPAKTRRAWRLLPTWSTKLPPFVAGLDALGLLGRRRKRRAAA
jgi:hypothetical protein